MSTVADTMDFAYTFPSGSNNGNVQKITNNIDWHRTQSFTYDSLNRISTAQTNADNQPAFQGDNSLQMCWAETFTYDPWGNLLTLGANTTTQSNYTGCTQESGFNYTGSIATNNRLAVSGFSYDAAGNMTASPGATYTYDAENHLITTHGVTYAYDGDGKRLTKSSGMMYWYGLNSDPLIETDLSNNLKAHYIFFNGQRVASENSSNSVNWYFADHLGTARLVFSLNGDDQSDFYPFGGERVMTTGAGNHYKFTGKERDSESGLDNFGARYNSSSMGRFMSPDWSAKAAPVPYARFGVPQSLNLYAYAQNNPINNRDMDGHWCVLGVLGSSCNTPPPSPPPPPPPSANTTVSNIYRYGDIAAAAGAMGNAAADAVDVVKSPNVTVSGQVGNVTMDNEGNKTVSIQPALAVNLNVNVNPPSADQTVLASPSVGVGKYASVGTDVVRDPNGDVHTQGATGSIGLSTPTLPFNVTLPLNTGGENWQILVEPLPL